MKKQVLWIAAIIGIVLITGTACNQNNESTNDIEDRYCSISGCYIYAYKDGLCLNHYNAAISIDNVTNEEEEIESETVAQDAQSESKEIALEEQESLDESIDDSSGHDRDSFISECQKVDYKTLLRDPDKYRGTKIKAVLEVKDTYEQYYDVVSYIRDAYSSEYYLLSDKREGESSKLLSGDIIIVYAECMGAEDIYGIDMIRLDAYYIDIIDEKQAYLEKNEEHLQDNTINVDMQSGTMTFKEAEIIPYNYVDEGLALWFSYTNTSQENKDPSWAADIKAFQAGIELEDVYLVGYTTEQENYRKEIQPGTTSEFLLIYKIESREDIEIEVSGKIDKYDKMTISFDEDDLIY